MEKRGFEELEPIFGEANAYSESSLLFGSHPFLFHVHALDTYRIRIHVTDFHSYTWEAVRSVQQLDDLRDNIGIGGSWSEFLKYFLSSMKANNVKLVMGQKVSTELVDDQSGETFARLVAHKSKGMPLISISLQRLMNESANDAMSTLSLELFKAFKSRSNTAEGEESCNQLMENSSAEERKIESIQNKLDVGPPSKKQKLQKCSVFDEALHTVDPLSKLDSMSASATDASLEKQSIQNPTLTKVGRRSVPTNRRAKVRGVILEDNEDCN